jgi:hypothetical protein
MRSADWRMKELESKIDGLVKSLKGYFLSFLRKQESSLFRQLEFLWIPVFTGMTTFYDFKI